jgi:uncharacterized YigZ family protein
LDIKDTYFTIKNPSPEILFKEKHSKFFGYAFPLTSQDQVKDYLDQLRKQHSTARHFCYAYQMGTTNIQYKTNDDGEPNNSAGLPIYGQIQSLALTNVLVVIVRYFGGIKLGVGGLVSAYKLAAQETLQECEIIEKTINQEFIISFKYADINKIMRIIKEKKITTLDQKIELDCEIKITARLKDAKLIQNTFSSIFDVNIKEV